jgi:hydrogenase-4 component F
VVADMRGMLRVRPVSAWLLLAGLFAVTGSPPFGLWVSEFSIISGAVREHHPWVAGATVVMLAIIFVGIARMILGIVFGEPAVADDESSPVAERPSLIVGPVILASMVLLLGLYIPAPLRSVVGRAAASLGGMAP